MLKIGITGGIGSGKSTVGRMFQVLDVPVFEADAEGKRILADDPDVRAAVTAAFGADAYPQGRLDRHHLAGIIFADPVAREKLNAIVHPAVRTAFGRWAADQEAPYVLMASALLVGSGGARALDGLVLVTAPETLRLQRVMARDDADEHAVRARMAAQLQEEEMRAAADHVIVNDDRRPVIPQVLEVHQALLQRATR
ncbi:MAG: dephospho-CoA kinase [Flavobacteriales bacterium]|nr:Dephospho-CoA kinase [Flavobacteriales bacterium]MCC6578575.1 dephospho-CoA kinase [Flavobacteriales bacterium]NUQ15827.1 dephospho-CoA kinase [Flavobacteriales bacterium]